MKALFIVAAVLLSVAAQAQQTNPQPPTAQPSVQPQPANVDELLKTLSPKGRDELLKRLQESGPQAQHPTDGTTVAPPPQASDDPKPHPAGPPKPKTPSGCE